MEDFVRWYSPRDWIACDEILSSHDQTLASCDHLSTSHDHSSASQDHSSPSHDQLCSDDVSITTTTTTGDVVADVTTTDDVAIADDITNNDTTDDVTNNDTTDVTKNSDVSGWDEDWAEVEEEPSNATSVTHKVTMVTASISDIIRRIHLVSSL